MWDLSSWTRDRPGVQCIGRWIPNLWTAREVPSRPSFEFFIDSLPFDIFFFLTFLEGRCPLQPRRLCEYEVPFNCSGLSWWLSGKESTCNAGNAGDVWETRVLSLGSGKSPGGRNGDLLQYSCLENSKETGVAGYGPRGSQRGGHDWARPPPCRLSCVVVKLFCSVSTKGQHYLMPHSDNASLFQSPLLFNSSRSHGLQHTRFPCPSLAPDINDMEKNKRGVRGKDKNCWGRDS